MLEKLGFQQLVEENLTIKRLTRASAFEQLSLDKTPDAGGRWARCLGLTMRTRR
jgi:hypothetical protein